MEFLEKDLELILFDTPQHLIRERGLPFFRYDTIHRQVSLGNYGRADIITASILNDNGERTLEITVYELKQKVLDLHAFFQVGRYMKGVVRVFTQHTGYDLHNTKLSIKGAIIGASVNNKFSDFPLCFDLISDVNICTYSYGFDGIHFNIMESSILKDEGNLWVLPGHTFSEVRQILEVSKAKQQNANL